MPPNQRPSEPRRSRTPKWSRAAVSTNTTSVSLSSGGIIPWLLLWRRGNEVAQQRHRLNLVRAGGFVDDHLQPRHLAFNEVARQQMETCRIDRRLEHRMTGTIESNEFAPEPSVNDGSLDARARRRMVDRSHLDLPPGAA